MKSYIVSLLFSFTSLLTAADVEIKSLRTYPYGNEAGFPVIVYNQGQGGLLTIEFDVKSNSVPDFHIVFKLCDRNWQPLNNAFLANHGKNTAYILDYASLPGTVEDARYHFVNHFPDDQGYVEFPYSGKWIYFITDAFDESIIYGSGKFYVVYSELPLSPGIKKEQLEDKIYFPSDLAKVFNLTTSFNLSDEYSPSFVKGVEIVENRKVNEPVFVGRDFNTNTRQFYWDGNRNFTFTARDLRPGNGLRTTDFRNTKKFGSKNIRAQFDGLEYSRYHRSPLNDLNGSSILTDFNDAYATYMVVNFSVRPPEELKRTVYLVGAFNEWQLLPVYEMKESAGIFSIDVNLKRGAYDYQYVFADDVNGEIKNADWYSLEGNNWEASNEYHIFLYYTSPDFGGYDKIIGYSTITSKQK
ncbi:MAG: DUF5103 domain-containing protein [Ignavibacteriales bacterium]|nr:MAG: DUF5103 domain-containing protein [Ignavibacteriales bacterium]